MSYPAIEWAKRQKIGSPIGKAILRALADYADEAGACYPSQASLADECECSVRSIGQWLSTLEEMGLLIRQVRRREDGYRTSDLIVLALTSHAGGSGEVGSHAGGSPENPAILTGRRCRPINRTISMNHQTLVASATNAPAAPSRFAEFWSIYPKREGGNPKRKAEQLFAGLVKRGIPEQRIIDRAKLLATRHPKPSQFVPMAKTWLAGEDFEDDVSPPKPANDQQWGKRLDYARKRREWAIEEWGPMPGQSGCRVPAGLVADGDGIGWKDRSERLTAAYA